MPSFQIFTNVPSKDIPEDFEEEMTEVVKNVLGKPSNKFVLVHVIPDQRMAFAGTREPCAVAEVCCVGQCDDAEQNKGYSAVLCEKINRSLKIPVNRMYITFSCMNGERVGWSGKTFAKYLPALETRTPNSRL